ncbi:MAG: adenosylcobinamide-phosphate synthase CbiB [Pseudomonadota bacterium]
MTATTLLIAWGVEAALGWPDALYRAIRHPFVWIGWLVTRADRLLNGEQHSNRRRLAAGTATAVCVIVLVYGVTAAAVAALPANAFGLLIQGLLASSLLASRSLYQHVAAVGDALRHGPIDKARDAVAHIVGRDPQQLVPAGIARAALESLAENTSDGVIAPLFWGVLFGVPGLAAYKAVNTLDSMIGHRNARYEHFGKAAARIDDVANWVPARLTSLLITVAGPRPRRTWGVVRNDARRHRSPNAGWPEAAMAGALAVRLSGPRRYSTGVTDEPWLNATAADPGAESIAQGLLIYRRALAVGALVLLVFATLSRIL